MCLHLLSSVSSRLLTLRVGWNEVSHGHRGSLAIEIECILCVVPHLAVEKVSTNHHPCPSFPGLAMNYRYIPCVLLQILVHVLAEWLHKHKRRCIVIIKWIFGNTTIELQRIISTFRTPARDINEGRSDPRRRKKRWV